MRIKSQYTLAYYKRKEFKFLILFITNQPSKVLRGKNIILNETFILFVCRRIKPPNKTKQNKTQHTQLYLA